MKFTKYFEAMRERPDRQAIDVEWINRVVDQPEREAIQHDGRIRRWSAIPEAGGKYLRVVFCLTARRCITQGSPARCLCASGG